MTLRLAIFKRPTGGVVPTFSQVRRPISCPIRLQKSLWQPPALYIGGVSPEGIFDGSSQADSRSSLCGVAVHFAPRYACRHCIHFASATAHVSSGSNIFRFRGISLLSRCLSGGNGMHDQAPRERSTQRAATATATACSRKGKPNTTGPRQSLSRPQMNEPSLVYSATLHLFVANAFYYTLLVAAGVGGHLFSSSDENSMLSPRPRP